MGLRNALQTLGPAAVAAALFLGCSSDPAPAPKADGNVFIDDFGAGVSFQAFSGATGEVGVDTTVKYAGTASLKMTIPGDNWNGGAFPTETPRDLSSFNALTLRARASRAVTLDVVGFGNDNTPTSPYDASLKVVPVTTDWTEIVIPIPDPAMLTSEDGLLYFADGETGGTYDLWFDDVKFVSLPATRLGAGAMQDASITLGVAATRTVETSITFPVDGGDVVVAAAPTWFTFASDHAEIASVDEKGIILGKAVGTATVTATLGDLVKTVSVEVVGANVPATAPPAPTASEADVISLFSDAYTAHPVDHWTTDWDNTADPVDVTLAGNTVKKFSALNLVGVEFTGANLVDASAMASFHLDVWTPDATELKIKLVDFGANGVWNAPGTGDDTEHELTFHPTNGQWVALDIPFTDFTNLTARAHLAQLIFVSSNATVFFDNVYFHK